MGWFERKSIAVSVVIGFLYMSISRFVCLRVIVKSRKFIDLWFSCVGFMLSFIWFMCVDGVWGGFLLCRIWLVCHLHIVCIALCSLCQGAVLRVCFHSVAKIFRLLSLKSGIPWKCLVLVDRSCVEIWSSSVTGLLSIVWVFVVLFVCCCFPVV